MSTSPVAMDTTFHHTNYFDIDKGKEDGDGWLYKLSLISDAATFYNDFMEINFCPWQWKVLSQNNKTLQDLAESIEKAVNKQQAFFHCKLNFKKDNEQYSKLWSNHFNPNDDFSMLCFSGEDITKFLTDENTDLSQSCELASSFGLTAILEQIITIAPNNTKEELIYKASKTSLSNQTYQILFLLANNGRLALLSSLYFDDLFHDFSEKPYDHFKDLTDMLIDNDLIKYISLSIIKDLYEIAKRKEDDEKMGVLNMAHIKSAYSQYKDKQPYICL
jgi:hypothetical protein